MTARISRPLLFLTLLGALGAMLRAQVTVHYINVGQAAAAVIELPKSVIMIDAGGETTENNEYAEHLSDYLNKFFQARPQFNNTLNAVIITHPHIDHTKNLMDVMETFNPNYLVDGGDDSGSGISPLKKAREYAHENKLHYIGMPYSSIRGSGRSLKRILDSADTTEISLLSGSRDCDNGNNNSLTIRIATPETTLLFTGDAEEDGDQTCDTGLLELLQDRFGPKNLLDVDVYHVAHHGSFNGTTEDFMNLVTPQISVISAGNPNTKSPGPFHAFQFGHPRQVAVDTIIKTTSGTRTPINVVVFPKVKQTTTISLSKAVYCTCWDGDVVVKYNKGLHTSNISLSGFHISP
jgi:competence protein ComEC